MRGNYPCIVCDKLYYSGSAGDKNRPLPRVRVSRAERKGFCSMYCQRIYCTSEAAKQAASKIVIARGESNRTIEAKGSSSQMKTYKIVRVYVNTDYNEETIEEHVTLEEAKAHCSSPDASSRTCKSAEGRVRTEKCGSWFDAFREE